MKKFQVEKVQFGSLITLYLVLLGFIGWINFFNLTQGKILNFESIPFSSLPLIGGLFRIKTILNKNVRRSLLGKFVIWISLGLIFWGVGSFIWTFYNFVYNIGVPYPSLSDVGYFFGYISWLISIIYLTKSIGVKYQTRTLKERGAIFIIPLIIFLVSTYFIFFKVYAGNLLFTKGLFTLFFDLGYPLMDILLLSSTSIILILSWKKIGASLKKPILFILAGFILLYISDFSFSYTTAKGTFHNGNWVDFLSSTALFLLSLGLYILISSFKKEKDFVYPLQCDDIFAELALKIIREEEKIIGQRAWTMALCVPEIVVTENRTLTLLGNKNEVINKLIVEFEQVLGESSRELAKDAIREISTLINSLCINSIISLNLKSAFFFVPHASTENFESIFPFGKEKFRIDRHRPIVFYLLSHKNFILKASMPSLIQNAKNIAEANDLKEIGNEMEKFQAEMAGGVYSDDALIGLLFLGQKMNQKPFQEKDLEYIKQLLQSVSGELGTTVHFRDTQASLLQHQKPS